MRIFLTGGGSGGHFYPLIAVAQSLRKIAREEKVASLEIYYAGPEKYKEGLLYDYDINFVRVPSGKIRRYFSIMNFFDIFKTAWGILVSFWHLFTHYPDVVFAKGAYSSFPVLFVSRILRIPVVIHESDTVPGKVNKWAGKFARYVAVSYPEASEFFPEGKVAYTGQPVRKGIKPTEEKAYDFFGFDPSKKTILVLGGSQGAKIINNNILGSLSELLVDHNVIHQAGEKNAEVVFETSEVVLNNEEEKKKRYKVFPFLDQETMSKAVGVADLVITRAGSTLFEIAHWQIPAIVIPITDSNGNHQILNAFAFARAGAGTVIEEDNLTSHILIAEIRRILSNKEIIEKMKQSAKEFSRDGGEDTVAKALIDIGMEHA